jgi:3-deoxy-D-manno-octulosonate 8-phosphate phosphatase (KDO 8-P phosphatase)
MNLTYFICDVDGCLNDGKIYWAADGKPFKAFGNYDHDGLKMLKQHLTIKFITADAKGWDISFSRICTHMGFELHLVKESARYDWVKNLDFETVAYMGDGFYDAPIIKSAAIGIAPAQARVEARRLADYVTPNAGGEGAVMDACLYVLDTMGVRYGF